MDKGKNIRCLEMNVKKMVKEDIKEKLYFQYNKLDNEGIIWQQMPIEHFYTFLKTQSLSFKKLAAYDEKNERKVTYYKAHILEQETDNSKKQLLEKLYKNFEEIAFISCWYYFKNLSRIAFQEYAGQYGIAIGTTVEQLKKGIEDNNNNASLFHEELYYGMTGYLEQKYIDVVKKEEAVAPIFLKSEEHSSDIEFRLLYLRDSLWSSDIKGLKLPGNIEERVSICVGDVFKVIKYIALKREINFLDVLLKSSGLKKVETTFSQDGFIVYELEKM